MLGWSINLFRIFGIQLSVHASFLLLAYYPYVGWKEGGIPGMLWWSLLIFSFFFCVVLHELGHSLTARRFGVNVPRILLTPIGGMAEFDRIPRRPSAELLITAAGPAVNFLIVAVLLPVVWGPIFSDTEFPEMSWPGFAVQLALANLLMGGFNLLPVFPMDGGRILRALLATRLRYLQATYWAAIVGKVLSVLLAAAALYFGYYRLAVLFGFIFFAADAEYRMLLRREQEAAYWAEMARRITLVTPSGREPEPPLLHPGPE